MSVKSTLVVMTNLARLHYIQGCRNFPDMHFNMAFTYMHGASHVFAVDRPSILILMVREPNLPTKVTWTNLPSSKLF